MRIGVLLVGLLISTCSIAEPVRAQGPSSTDATAVDTSRSGGLPGDDSSREEARRYFDEGIALYREKQFSEALQAFENAHRVYQSPVFVFNMARTCDELGEVTCALRHYRSYRREAPDAPEKALVDERIRALEALLRNRGIQQVTVTTSPDGVTLAVDGVELGKTPWTGELVPGTHRIRLTGPGYSDVEVDVDVPAAHAIDRSYDMQRVEVEPPVPLPAEPVVSASSARRRQPTPPPPIQRATPVSTEPTSAAPIGIWTYAVLGAGAASLTGAAIFELLRRDSEADVRELPVQRERVDAYHTMEARQTTARVLAGIGAGLSAAGITLLVLDLRSAKSDQASLSARVRTRGRHLVVEGRW